MEHFSQSELMQVGVLKLEDSGAQTCKFLHNRLIIPIFDVYDQPIAIIGRVLCGEEERKVLGVPKYNNTVFPKTKCLFGLNLAKKAAREKGALMIVEGNFDVIAAVQAGVENVVACSSANVSSSQIALASRYAERITIALDADEAGQKSMDALFKKPHPEGIVLKRLNVPGGFKDWDEYFCSKLDQNQTCQ